MNFPFFVQIKAVVKTEKKKNYVENPSTLSADNFFLNMSEVHVHASGNVSVGYFGHWFILEEKGH